MQKTRHKKSHASVPFMQSWAHRSLKSLNHSLLLSEPLFWEQWRSIRIRAKSDEQTDKIQILSGLLMSDIGIKERRINGEKRIKMHNVYIF